MKHKEPAKKPKKVIGFSINLFAKYKSKSIWKAVKTPKNIPGIIKTIQIKSKLFEVLYFDGLLFSFMTSQPFIFIKFFLWIKFTNIPETKPTKNPINIINNPILGSLAISKKAASPIVAVNVATTEPKETFPREYWVKTIIAPPQPGSAPRNELTKISNFGLLLRTFSKSIFRYFSNE